MDKGLAESALEGTPSTSAESSGNSGKSSVPRSGELTGKTSLFDSKYSQKSKIASQHSSENKKILSKQATPEGGSNENPLTPIAEVEVPEDPVPIPSECPVQTSIITVLMKCVIAVVTAEKAAAAKVFFETQYNILTSGEKTPRSMRRRQLEEAFCHDISMSPGEKANIRRAWARDETDHLREIRVMKSHTTKGPKGKATSVASKYETVKILGKGSFGVVRLVREKPGEEYVLPFKCCQRLKTNICLVSHARRRSMP
jgi:protein-serine/threonine kinase